MGNSWKEMTLDWIESFRILQIKPTNDKKEIKIAYSKLLKKYNPEDYPDLFIKIQEAYETALKYSGNFSENTRNFNENNFSKNMYEEKSDEYEKMKDNNVDNWINEVKKLFSPLELEYENNVITIINKKELLKKLIDETYNFFIKYPNKIEEMNSILNDMKKGLEYENFEQEIDEESIYPYIFKINLFLDKEEKILKSKSPEIISEYNVPTIINYLIKGIHRNKIKIFFDEKLDEEEVSFEEIKFELKKELNISESEFFDFNFTIKGYYIYNVSTDTVEKIEVDKEIKFYNITTVTKRILELEGFDENEKDEGKTYEEAVADLFEYLNLLKKKKVIKKEKFVNFIDEIAFAEREKIFKTLKEYVEMNKIDFLEFDTRKIYIGTEELLKVIEELFFAIRLNTKVKEAKIEK